MSEIMFFARDPPRPHLREISPKQFKNMEWRNSQDISLGQNKKNVFS